MKMLSVVAAGWVLLFSGAAQRACAGSSGWQVWNRNPLATDNIFDSAPAGQRLGPITLVGARNGIYSGKVIAGSSGSVRGLRAACTSLKGPGGSNRKTDIRIRYGIPWGADSPWPRPYPNASVRMACLSDAALPAYTLRAARGRRGRSSGGTAVPVWVTVKVPADAKPGLYRGRMTIAAAGGSARVPVELKVLEYALPDPVDYVTWVDCIQSPDTLAVEYGLPLWSKKHWKYIARSFELLGELGSKAVYIPLICHTNLGNEESMVRWIPKGRGRYKHDFSIMEQYLDLAEKHMGKPKTVIFVVWDLYMLPKAHAMSDDEARRLRRAGKAPPNAVRHTRMALNVQEHKGQIGLGPLVTVAKSGTSNAKMVELPKLEDPGSQALWRPLMSWIRARLGKRGLGKSMMLGIKTGEVLLRLEDKRLALAAMELQPLVLDPGGSLPRATQVLLSTAHHRRHSSAQVLRSTGQGFQPVVPRPPVFTLR